MEFDPFLYVAFVAGLVVGWRTRPHGVWLERATLATVGVLVALLGASLSTMPAGSLLSAIPLAAGFAGLILLLTSVLYALLARGGKPGKAPPIAPNIGDRGPLPTSAALLAALVGGYLLRHAAPFPAAQGIAWALYALLFVVALGLRLRTTGLTNLWIPLVSAVLGGIGAGLIYAELTRTSLAISFSTSLAFGWYTLAGPLVEAKAGALLGLIAFLTNFLREDLTMLLSPLLGRRMKGEGLAAMGGATSMDTTLYFITRYGDRDSASVALATGLVLTVTASLLLPALLATA